MQALSALQTRRLRLRSQRLDPRQAPPADGVSEVIRGAGSLQAQDAAAASLGVRARSAGLAVSDVEKALYQEHSVVHTWLMRGTLHYAAANDLAWMLPLLGPVFIAGSRRRKAELGLDEASLRRGVEVIRAALGRQTLQTRQELAPLLEARGIQTAGQALIHVINQAALEGVVCVGPRRGGKDTYALLEDWIGPLRPMERPAALVELARRYLLAYAPAAVEDFAAWSGLPAREAHLGWEGLAGEVVEVEADGRPAWFPLARRAWLEEAPSAGQQVRLLPFFDGYLLGYHNRDFMLAPENRAAVLTGGIIQSVLLVDGRAAGIWHINKRHKILEVVVVPFGELPAGARAELEAEAEDVGRFLGENRMIVMFRELRSRNITTK